MNIRIMFYSIRHDHFIILIGGILLTAALGPILFLTIFTLLAGLFMLLRAFLFWFTYDGPMMRSPMKTAIIAVCLLCVSTVLFLNI